MILNILILHIVVSPKTDFFYNFNRRISVTMDFEHIDLIPVLLLCESPFEWCSWFTKILNIFLVTIETKHMMSRNPGWDYKLDTHLFFISVI